MITKRTIDTMHAHLTDIHNCAADLSRMARDVRLGLLGLMREDTLKRIDRILDQVGEARTLIDEDNRR